MPVRTVELKQIYCCVCDVPGPSSVTLSGAVFDALTVGWECVFSMYLCPSCNEQGLLPADTPDLRVATVPEPACVVEGV